MSYDLIGIYPSKRNLYVYVTLIINWLLIYNMYYALKQAN